jgi:L,D-transpeptidase catalytic domain
MGGSVVQTVETPPLDFLRELRIKTPSKIMQRFFLRFLQAVLSIALILLATGCGEDPRFSGNTSYIGGGIYGGGEQAGPPRDTVSYWDGDQASGSPSIKISLGEQRAYFYKSGLLVGVSQLSTGREGRNTPYGHFSVMEKDKNHASNLYGDYVDSADNVIVPNVDVKKDPKPPGTHFKGASMPYYMQIAPGFGLHAGYLPGYPASHGCIRMPEFMAEDFFRSVSVGTPVTITN